MSFFDGAWLTGLLTRYFSREEQSRDGYLNLEISRDTQGSSAASDNSEASSLDKLSSPNHSLIKSDCPSVCTSSSTSAQSAVSLTHSRETAKDSKDCCTPASNKKHSSSTDAIWEISRSMVSDKEKSYFEALNPKSFTLPITNPGASGSNKGLPLTTKTSRTTSSNLKSSIGHGILTTTGSKRVGAKDCSSEKSNSSDSDPENPWTKVVYSKRSRFKNASPKNSSSKALSLESTGTPVADLEKSSIKVTDPESCSVDTPCQEFSNSLNSMSLELASSDNQTAIDSIMESSPTTVTSMESSPTTVTSMESSPTTVTSMESSPTTVTSMERSPTTVTNRERSSTTVTNMESFKLIGISPESSSVMNTTVEISNTRDSTELTPISSNEQTIKDENENDSSNFVTNTEISKITITSPKSSNAKVSSQNSYDSTGSSTEGLDSTDSSTESSWTTVTYSKNSKARTNSQKNCSLKGQSLASSNNVDSYKNSPAAVSYSKDFKPRVTTPTSSNTSLLNVKGSTNPNNSKNAVTNMPRSYGGWAQNIRPSGPFLRNTPRTCKMTQNPSTSKTENLAHSSVKVGFWDEYRNLCGNFSNQGCQAGISVPSSGRGKARYSEVVRKSLSNTQCTNEILNDTQVKALTPSGVLETSLATSGIAETSEIEAVANDCLTNPPTIIINPPDFSPLIGNSSPKSFTKDMASTSISTGNENFSTTSLNSPLYNSSQSMTSLNTPAASSDAKNSAISTNSEDEPWRNLISVKNIWENLAPIPLARSDPDSGTPRCSPAKMRISPIGDERSKRSKNRSKRNQLPEQPSDSTWRPETEKKQENINFSSLPSLEFSLFNYPSQEKWLTDSQRTTSTTVKNLTDSLVANNSCEVIAVSSSSNPRACLTEPRHESSSLREHPKEIELPDNCNERKDCIETLSQPPLTSESQSVDKCSSFHLPSKETPESLEEKKTSHNSKETNAPYGSQECRSITSDLKSSCTTTSDHTNLNDEHPDTEGQQSTYEDIQARHTADNIQGRGSAFEDLQIRNCIYEESQSREHAEEDAHGLDEHGGSQDQISAHGSAQAQGSPHGGSQVEDTVNASSQNSEHKNVQNSTLPVLQLPHLVLPVYPGQIYMYSGSADPHRVYVNSSLPNYPYPIAQNTHLVYGNNAHPGLASEGYASSGGAYPPPPSNTCQLSASQTLSNEPVMTQSTFQQPTTTNCSVFESPVTTGTQSDNALLSQSLPYITNNRPLTSSSMAGASSHENFCVPEYDFQSSVDLNETNHGASGQHIPNPAMLEEESMLKQTQSTYGHQICPDQFYREPPNSFTDGHPLDHNQSSFGQPPDLIQSAYGHPLVRNQLPYGQPSVQNQYPCSQPLEQNQSLCMPDTVQSPYRQSLGPIGPPHGQTPEQNRFLHGHLPDQNQTFYGQSANPIQPHYGQNPPLYQHSSIPTQPPGQNHHPSMQTPVPIHSPIMQSPEQNQQPPRQTFVTILSRLAQPPGQNLQPSRHMPVQIRPPFRPSREQNQQPSRHMSVPIRPPFRPSREQNQQPSRHMSVPIRPPFRQPNLRNQSYNEQTLESNQSSYEQPRDSTQSPPRLTWAGWTTRQSSRRGSPKQPSPKWSTSS